MQTVPMRTRISYGVDIGAHGGVCVRAVRDWRGRVQTTLLHRADGGIAEAIRSDLRPGRAALVCAAVPATDTALRRLKVPFASRRRARKVLPSLLDVQLPFRLEDAVAAFPEVRLDGGNVVGLGVACPLDAAWRRLEDLAAKGLDPEILDCEALAAWESAAREGPPADGAARIVVHATPERWLLAIGDARGLETVLTLRNPPPDDNAIPGEGEPTALRRLRAAAVVARGEAGRAVEWAWLGRPAAYVARWRDRAMGEPALAGRLVPVEAPEAALARALAVRALEGSAWAANLRRGRLAHRGWMRCQQREAVRAAAALLAAAALVASVGAVHRWRLGREEAALRDRLAREAARLGGLARVQPGFEVRMAREAVERSRAEWAPVERLFQPGPAAVLAGLLRAATQAGASFHTVEITDRVVNIEGSGPSRDSPRALGDLLRLLGREVRLVTSEAPSPEGRWSFTLEGRQP